MGLKQMLVDLGLDLHMLQEVVRAEPYNRRTESGLRAG